MSAAFCNRLSFDSLVFPHRWISQGMHEVLAPFVALSDPELPTSDISLCYSAFIKRFLPYAFNKDEEFLSLQVSVGANKRVDVPPPPLPFFSHSITSGVGSKLLRSQTLSLALHGSCMRVANRCAGADCRGSGAIKTEFVRSVDGVRW